MNRRKWKIICIAAGVFCIVLLLIAAAAIGINNSRNSYQVLYDAALGTEKMKSMDEMAVSEEADMNAAADGKTPASAPGQNTRKIIVTASMGLDVQDLGKSIRQAEALADASGGYIESSGITTLGDASRQASLVLRVPVEAFDKVMADLRKIAAGVSDESISRADVTMEYVDIEARLKNMQEHENALRTMWAKAKDVEDLIKIEGELARVQGEIESLTAQKKVMDNQIQLATINLSMTEEASSVPSNPKGDSLAKQAMNAFTSSISLIKYSAGWLVIAFAGLFPLLLLAAVIILVIHYLIKGKKTKANLKE